MFHRLLIATDFSDGLQRLVQFIPDLAQAGLQQVTFLHCVPVQDDRSIPHVDETKLAEARQQLAPALADRPDPIMVNVEVTSGRPSEAIVKAIARYDIDLLMLGMSAKSLLDEKLFGSTTCELAQLVSIPLLILRPQLVSAYTAEELSLRCQHLFRYLLIPYDGSESGQQLVAFIQQQAANRPAHSLEACLLCWVAEPPGRSQRSFQTHLNDKQAALKKIQADLQQLDLTVEYQVRTGNAIAEINQVALELDISAIAVSSRHFGRLWELSVPSFAGEIIRRSWHPVLFIPPSRP
jgi:nucleotide-binding universal stress UspA family protein